MQVVWLLGGDTLVSLRRALQPYSVGKGASGKGARIPLEAFVSEVYRAICLRQSSDYGPVGRSPTETRYLVERMCVLFELVDVDSVGTIDWESFTDFCVAMRGRDSGNQELQKDEFCKTSGGRRSQPDEMTRFVEKLGYIDRSSRCHEIRSMRFVKGLEILVVVEGTAILNIYSAGPHKIGQIEPALAMRKLMIDSKRSARVAAPKKLNSRGGGVSTLDEHATATGEGTETLAVLAMEFIGRVNQAAVSCADRYLTIWDLETLKLLRHVRMRDAQVGLRFCPSMGVLTSWGVDEFNHEIIVWNVDKLTVMHVLDGHSGAVKDICEVAPPPSTGTSDPTEKIWEPILATTGMDRKVVLWDLRLGSESRPPRKLSVLAGHYHGVLSLAYSTEHDLILSAGFDFEANCWDRSTNHLHKKLVGHRVSLIGVVIVEHETQRAVTGDESGSFRLWDIQRGDSDHGTCLQVFSLQNTRVSPRSMVVVWKEGLIVAGSKMHVFRAAPSVPMEATPLGAWFSSYTGEVCVVLREAIMFDAATGGVKRRVFQQTHGREITAFCMDARHKRAVVGNQGGGLRVYDGVTGRWTMSANPHGSEVSALLFVDEDNAFISAGWDGMIQIHDARVRSSSTARSNANVKEEKGERSSTGHRCAFTLRSVVKAHDGDITLMAASARFGLIATASSDLTVRLWDYQLLRLEDVLVAHRQEITCVRFLDPLPCLATADVTGKVLIWATRPHPNGGALLVAIRNSVITAGRTMQGIHRECRGGQARDQRKVLPTPVTCIAFRHHKPGESDPTHAAAADLRARQDRELAPELKEIVKPSDNRNRDGRSATQPNIPVKHSLWEVGSILFTGDELGSIKVWDLTDVLLKKLGSATCSAKNTEDKAAIPPASFDTASHHFIHHRQGPLDGVGLQAARRFGELIDIARALRRGEVLKTVNAEPDSDSRRSQAGLDCGGGIFVGEGDARHCSCDVESSAGSVAANSTTERLRDRSFTRRRKQEQGVGRSKKKEHGESSPQSSPARSLDNVCRSQQNVRRPVGPKGQVEASLNARPEDIQPVASWIDHEDSIISVEIVCSPPSIITASLDGYARISSLDGALLGVLTDKQNAAGTASPWRFQPPPTGRNVEAGIRAAALTQTLKDVRREERQLPTGVPGNSTLQKDPRTHGRYTPLRPPNRIPVTGSDSRASKYPFAQPVIGGKAERVSLPGNSVVSVGVANGGVKKMERRSSLKVQQTAVAAACLSRINEVTQKSVADRALGSDAGSGSQGIVEDSIDTRLLNEAREGLENQRGGGVKKALMSADDSGEGWEMRYDHNHPASRLKGPANAPPPPVQKSPPNLRAELEKKHAKRTRTTLDFLSENIGKTAGGRRPETDLSSAIISRSKNDDAVEGPRVKGRAQHNRPRAGCRPFTSPGIRERNSIEDDEMLTRQSSELSPASNLRHAVGLMAPYLILRLDLSNKQRLALSTQQIEGKEEDGEAGVAEGASRNTRRSELCGTSLLTKKSVANVPLTQPSAVILASARSARSTKSYPSLTRPGVSTTAAVARRMAADRRHRRMDCILDGVRRIGQQGVVVPPLSFGPGADNQGRAVREHAGVAEEEADAVVGNWGAAAAGWQESLNVTFFTRVKEILFRFERCVNGRDDLDQEFNTQAEHKAIVMRRQLEARTAARKEAMKHHDRYRRAKRYDLVTLQETQLRRQEAMVGLTGPSGERFGPYSLDDVLDFQAFANNLNSQSAGQLTMTQLVEHPDIRTDPYSYALLNELMKLGLLQPNQPLAMEKLMQLVFHFAKHDETKRIVAVMDIAVLLGRLRDTFVAAKSSLMGNNGSLPLQVINDIDVVFRTAGAEACGTCTVRDLFSIMARMGSDLFPCGQEELEALAAQSGIVDGHKELTAADFTVLLTKLVFLHQQSQVGDDS